MFRTKFLLKLSGGIVSAFIILLTIMLLFLGAIHAIETTKTIIEYISTHNSDLHPGIAIFDTLDVFLFALVFLIFSIGITRLFIRHNDDKFDESIPMWLRIKSFSELKFLLMEAIIAMLYIFTITVIVKHDAEPSIEWLYVPAIILVLSISLRVLKWKR